MGSSLRNIGDAFPFLESSAFIFTVPVWVSPPCRRSVIEVSRALKELFHEARERASKALGFAKMLRKVREQPR